MKKMRKLIPAFAMLLVSAIMMSTASFAWFTMNQEVTATGMQVQAQASGSMIIDTNPLTALSNKITIDYAAQGSKKLSPVTYLSDATTAAQIGWAQPADDNLVDPITGAPTTDFTNINFTKDTHYVENVVYVGLAGASETWNIKATLESTNQISIAGAYAVAFYVDIVGEDGAKVTVPANETPDLILHVANGVDYAVNNGLLFAAPTVIPSVVGVDGTNVKAVGIQITMRVFVDGNLKNGTQYTPTEESYTSAKGTAYNANTTYYKVVSGEGETAVYDFVTAADREAYTQAGDAAGNIREDWFTMSMVDGTPRDVYYVCNGNVPAVPTGLNVSFELVSESRSKSNP